jgi:hypothetical protein
VVRIRSFPRLTAYTIVLLAGCFLVTSYHLAPIYHWTTYPIELLETQNKTLSQGSPVYQFNVTMSSPVVTITSLHTNNTPVTLVVRGPTQVQFNATNITSLTMVPLKVARVETDLWVEVIRQESDANITITIVFQTGDTALPPPSVPPPPSILPPLAGAFLVVFSLGMLFHTTSRFKHHRNERIVLLTAILLLLIGTSLCYPLRKGQIQGDFIPMYTAVTLPDENFSFNLNDTNLWSSLNLSSLYPVDGIVTSYRVHSISSDNYPIALRISGANESELVLAKESRNSNWWLTAFPDPTNSTIISFERVNRSAIVNLSVRRDCLILQPREDITLPTLYFNWGIVSILVCFVFAIRVDLSSKSEKRKSLGAPPAIE